MIDALDPEHRADKRALFWLAALVVTVLGGVVLGVFWRATVPDKGDVLLGGITTGLILFLRDLVNAVRSSWDAVTQGRVMDQLGKSQPSSPDPAPQDAVDAANQTADAAVDRAAEIEAGEGSRT